jgi:hypothetical protein
MWCHHCICNDVRYARDGQDVDDIGLTCTGELVGDCLVETRADGELNRNQPAFGVIAVGHVADCIGDCVLVLDFV